MAITQSRAILHGSDHPLQEPALLRAGPVTAALDGVDLRYVRLGDTELVRRIYVAVRDRNWNTIPGVASAIEVDQRDEDFDVRFAVRHTSHDTDFSWNGAISGHSDGRIGFAMDGKGEQAMLYNRIGFCVLHPWRESAGARFRGETPGGPVSGELPGLVAPQRFAGGVYVPLFGSVSRLEIDLEGGGEVVFEFEGDLFETEDQRNWTDASLKTYCTPLASGFPHELKSGERRAQTVTVYPRHVIPSLPRGAGDRATLTVGRPCDARLVDVGLTLPDTRAPSDAEARLLRALAPAHLRHELHLGQPGWQEDLQAAQAAARALDGGLELALFVDPEPAPAHLAAVGAALRDHPPARALVAIEGAQTTTPQETTPGAVVAGVREALALGPGVPVAGGTDMYFCELNRTRPDVDAMDGVFWSMNAQVHAFDDLSVMETPEAQGEQARTARAFSGGRPLFVGPVTLRRRYNVNATAAEGEGTEQLPDSVDPRQASLMAAAWTLASLKHLSEQGAASATYFETVGWRGVIQGDADPPRPDAFPSRAGWAFPLFHVLADAGELRGGEMLQCDGPPALEVAALAVAGRGGGVTILIANLTPRRVEIATQGIGEPAAVRRLNAETAEQAMRDPLRFRVTAHRESVTELGLAPYETVRIDT